MSLASLREGAAALITEWPRFEWHLRRGSWTAIRNRWETIVGDPSTGGYRCDWRWTSELRLCRSFPGAAYRLYRAATAIWPIALSDRAPESSGGPDISFIVPHKGSARTPNLLVTLASIAGQAGVGVECVVVEQGEPASVLGGVLPSWVRHVVVTAPADGLPFNKSWLLNVGVSEATAPVVVIHDNDMLVPESYSREILRRHELGFDVIDLKRFIFYLDEASSRRTFATRTLEPRPGIESVVQNLTAGGTMAVGRSAYQAIGGYDETFYGWGGHDTDFWERALTLRVDDHGYLPIVHLWHAASAGKVDRDEDPGVRRYLEVEPIEPRDRIAVLSGRRRGEREGPFPPWKP